MDTAAQDGAPCTASLFNTLKAAEAERAVTPTNQPLPTILRAALAPFAPPQSEVQLSDEDCQEIDMAMHRYKTNGGSQQYEQDLATGVKSRYGRGVY
jgi:hypothetical protein